MSGLFELGCPVSVDPQCKLGVFANAFRILSGPEEELFLDFILFSALEGWAEVVSRVRVSVELIPGVRSHLDLFLQDLTEYRSDESAVVPLGTRLN